MLYLIAILDEVDFNFPKSSATQEISTKLMLVRTRYHTLEGHVGSSRDDAYAEHT